MKTSGAKARSQREKQQEFQVFNIFVSIYINTCVTLDEAFIQNSLQGHNVCSFTLCKHYVCLFFYIIIIKPGCHVNELSFIGLKCWGSNCRTVVKGFCPSGVLLKDTMVTDNRATILGIEPASFRLPDHSFIYCMGQ